MKGSPASAFLLTFPVGMLSLLLSLMLMLMLMLWVLLLLLPTTTTAAAATAAAPITPTTATATTMVLPRVWAQFNVNTEALLRPDHAACNRVLILLLQHANVAVQEHGPRVWRCGLLNVVRGLQDGVVRFGDVINFPRVIQRDWQACVRALAAVSQYAHC